MEATGQLPQPLQQVVADAKRVGHRRESRVDGTDADEEARVHHVQIVQLVRPAVDVEHRSSWIGPEAARARLMGDAGNRDRLA